MSVSSVNSLKIKAKLLQKSKRRKGHSIALKDSFAIIAKAAGYSSWKEMKDSYKIGDILNPPQWGAQWKVWFSSEEEARDHHQACPGTFLVPYRKHFFVCDMNYINALGIFENDSDLQKVGRDWTSPKNEEAWARMLEKMDKHNRRGEAG